MIEKILKEICRLKKDLEGYSAVEALDYIESYVNILQRDQPESELEKVARYVYESWNGGTMDDVRRDMDELGKVLNARKED